jgi:hypothetical protein
VRFLAGKIKTDFTKERKNRMMWNLLIWLIFPSHRRIKRILKAARLLKKESYELLGTGDREKMMQTFLAMENEISRKWLYQQGGIK